VPADVDRAARNDFYGKDHRIRHHDANNCWYIGTEKILQNTTTSEPMILTLVSSLHYPGRIIPSLARYTSICFEAPVDSRSFDGETCQEIPKGFDERHFGRSANYPPFGWGDDRQGLLRASRDICNKQRDGKDFDQKGWGDYCRRYGTSHHSFAVLVWSYSGKGITSVLTSFDPGIVLSVDG